MTHEAHFLGTTSLIRISYVYDNYNVQIVVLSKTVEIRRIANTSTVPLLKEIYPIPNSYYLKYAFISGSCFIRNS